MYTPAANRETDLPTLRQFVRDNPLCALVTQTPAGLVASHIPVVLHDAPTGFGLLRGHVARGNTQWQHLTEEALGIFTGPQHYISASWYPGKQIHGREVPTWNYVAVHIYGRLRAIEDPDWLLEHLRTLTDANEGIAEIPWKLADAPPDFLAKLSRAIVGLEFDVSRVEGKWKASQNRTEDDATAVLAGLQTVNTPEATAMQHLVRTRRPADPTRPPLRHHAPRSTAANTRLIQPTGKRAQWTASALFRLEAGKLVEFIKDWNKLVMWEQLDWPLEECLV